MKFSEKNNLDGNGSYPTRGLRQASNGKLYGTTSAGGANNGGVVFNYDIVTNTYTKLLDFGGTSIGCTAPSCDIQEMQARATPNTTNTGIANLKNNLLQSYPNPAIDEITVSGIILSKESNIEITDMQGRTIDNISHKGNVFSVSNLASGVYSIRVVSGEKVMEGKFVKQ